MRILVYSSYNASCTMKDQRCVQYPHTLGSQSSWLPWQPYWSCQNCQECIMVHVSHIMGFCRCMFSFSKTQVNISDEGHAGSKRNTTKWSRNVRVMTQKTGSRGWESLQMWPPADLAPWMHWLADQSNEKDNLHLNKAMVVLYGWSHVRESVDSLCRDGTSPPIVCVHWKAILTPEHLCSKPFWTPSYLVPTFLYPMVPPK